MTHKTSKAFTIVEMLVVITVVAILSTLAIVTFASVRQDSRDAARTGNVTVIAEALEKYYEKNGEYPSVASIANTNASNTGAAIAAKLGIPPESLVMPKAPSTATNSITSGTEPTNDYVVYVGVSSLDNASCQTDVNGGCDQYILKYKEETGETQVIESRRASREVVQKPDLTVVATGPSQINASWSSIANATSYNLQRSLSADMSSPVASSHATTAASATGLTANTTYYFRVQAILPSTTSDWSDVASTATNGVTAPTGGLTITATMSGTNAVGTGGGGTCAAGTLERQMRYHATNTATAGTWSSYTAGSPRSVPATEGYRYTFQQEARCVSGTSVSGWVASGTANTIRPIATPAAPGLTNSTVGSTTTWTASGSCPIGTTATYQRMSLQQGGAWSAWEGTTTSNTSTWLTSAEGYTYSRIYHVLCSNAITSSAYSGNSVTSSYTRPVTVPSASTWSHTSLGWQNEANCMYYAGCKWRRFNWVPPTCPAGTSYFSSRWNSYVGTKMSWDNGQGQAYRWWYGWSQTGTTTDSVAYSSQQNSHIVEYPSNIPANYDDVKHKVITTCRNPTTGATGTTETTSPVFRYM